MASSPSLHSSPFALPRLYAILDVESTRARNLDPLTIAAAWLQAGVQLIQLRAKGATFGPFLELADCLATECRRAGALFIVNDRVDVGRLCGADGVHLGQDDLAPADARAVWPDARWIGLSTHTDAQVEAALSGPATYLATGPVFATMSKAQPDPVIGLEGVRRAADRCRAAGRPLVAIGGITAEQAPSVIEAGADSVAVISALLEGDPGGRARDFVSGLR